MQDNDFSLLQDLYADHLATIEGIHFTPREVDVMACLLNARGTSKISSLLGLSSHTVITHVRNVLSKVECSSREGIIDFIEKSHKSILFKRYYAGLVVSAAFSKSLEKVSKLKKERESVCLILCGRQQNDKKTLFQHLENHLEQAGLQAEILHEKSAHKINNEDYGKILVLLSNAKDLKDCTLELAEFDSLLWDGATSYYFTVFNILKKVLPNSNLDPIISSFRDNYEAMKKSNPSSDLLQSRPETKESSNLPKQLTSVRQIFNQMEAGLRKKTGYWIAVPFLICFVGMGLWTQYTKQPPSSTLQRSAARSDLILPTASVFLNRPELMTQLDNKFKEQTGIQAVALVGMGGVGKTTLARQYASTQNAPVIWQIKAENHESLKNSFEDLASALAKTEEDEKSLRGLKDIQDPKEKSKKIISFVKEKMKNNPHWFLIYDNVESFSDIQDYFPQDPIIWGSGRIILTTRDINIQNNKHITHVIPLGELDQPQKLTLFVNIMTNGNPSSFTSVQKKEAIDFLTTIPPFPLDIALAAYYLKATNISYEDYLDHLAQWERGFENVQENVLKESGDYAKTRYHIVALSIKQLMEAHKDFGDLLLFMSFLDSHHIPRDLLDSYKEGVVVDDFIYHLKKYSLITDEKSLSSLGQMLSMHPSTQEIGFSYLTKALDLNQNKKLLQTISDTLKNYMADAIDKEDMDRMKLLVNHCESFLKHDPLVEASLKESIGNELGGIYFSLSNYPKAQHILEENLKQGTQNQTPQMAHTLVYLSLVYRSLANYEKAKALLEQAFQIYQHLEPNNHARMAQVLSYLGSLEGDMGNYEKSKDLLEQSFQIYKEHYPHMPLKRARVLTSLGNLYREFYEFDKAKEVLEESLKIYRQEYPENHVRIAWALATLGNVYRSAGQYQKSKDLLEESLVMYQKNYPETDFSVAWVSTHLGNTYKELGQYQKARDLLEKSSHIYAKYFNESHIGNAWALIHLGNTYKALGENTKAKEALEKGHHIYQTYNLGTVWSSTHLGNFYQDIGQYEKAKELLEYSHADYQKYPSEKDIRKALVLRYLGNVYRGLKDYAKAKDFLEQSKVIYENAYAQNHIETARILQDLGKIYLLEGNVKEAALLLRNALVIMEQTHHPDINSVFEALSELELKRAADEEAKRNTGQAQIHKAQATVYINKALDVVRAHFSEDSPHIKRIQSR